MILGFQCTICKGYSNAEFYILHFQCPGIKNDKNSHLPTEWLIMFGIFFEKKIGFILERSKVAKMPTRLQKLGWGTLLIFASMGSKPSVFCWNQHHKMKTFSSFLQNIKPQEAILETFCCWLRLESVLMASPKNLFSKNLVFPLNNFQVNSRIWPSVSRKKIEKWDHRKNLKKLNLCSI